MKILGIDPSLTATGYGLIDYQNQKIKLIETGTIEPKKKDLFENRIKKIYTLLDELIEQYKPNVLVLEQLYAHHKHPITASILGHVRGVVCLLCAQKNVKLAEYSVKRIRSAIVGNGNASKVQTRRVVAHILHISEEKLTLDASDALALSIGYAQINSRQI